MPLDLSSSFSALGHGGHHIYGHDTHALGKITEHGHVLDGHGRPIGSIGHDGTIRDHGHHKIGRIDSEGKVHTRWSSHTQIFNSGNEILDHRGKPIGTSSAGSLGGAAMLLMLNKDR